MAAILQNGVVVTAKNFDDLSKSEIQNYINHVRGKIGKEGTLTKMKLTLDGKNVNIDYEVQMPKFERIRRITGASTRIARKAA